MRLRSEHRKVLIFSQFKKVTFISRLYYFVASFICVLTWWSANARFWTLFMTIVSIEIGLIIDWMVFSCFVFPRFLFLRRGQPLIQKVLIVKGSTVSEERQPLIDTFNNATCEFFFLFQSCTCDTLAIVLVRFCFVFSYS